MRELEASLQPFAEFLLKAPLVRPNAAPFLVRAVRQFLLRPATDESLADRVRRFCEDLERAGRQDWQVQQAEQALRIYFVNVLNRTDWRHQPASPVVDTDGRVDPLAALQQLRARIRTRHYSSRTESSYADWVRRFLDYLAHQHGPRPQVTAAGVRDVLTHLAVHRHVSASTQNQAQCALLFLARDVLGLEVDGLGHATRATRGERLPVVLSVPETAALLEALRGTSRLMASLISGGGLRVSACCQLRVKDLDFESGLLFVRRGKGDKDRSTWLPDTGRDTLRAHLRDAETVHDTDRKAGLAGVSLPDAIERTYPNAGRELAWFWVFPSRTLSTDPRAGIVRRHHLHESVIKKAVKEAATIARIHLGGKSLVRKIAWRSPWYRSRPSTSAFRVRIVGRLEIVRVKEMDSMSAGASEAAQHPAWVISADARDGFAARVREVWQYRRILSFFAVLSIQSLYRKTYLGVWWLFIRTLLPLLVGTYVFGTVLNIPSGGVPYFVFLLVGQIPWSFFEGSIGRASRGIDANRQLLTKLYIPRIILPLGQMAAGIVEPIITAGILVVTLVYYRRVDGVWYVQPDLQLMAAFAVVLVVLWFSFALSLFTSVWQGRTRDMRFALGHIVGFWFFLTPVAFPATRVPIRFRWLIYLNPLAGAVETFKWAVLPGLEHSWTWFIYSVSVTALLFAAGLWYFARSEGATMDKL